MNRLPSRGRCHAAFLLAYSARIAAFPNLSTWVENARTRSTIMAAASDISGTANLLIDSQLANIDQKVEMDENLHRVSFKADHTTLLVIASLILERHPPDWLKTSVVNDRLLTDLIPDADLRQLEWIGNDLEPIILHINRKLTSSNEEYLREQIGNAGELAIMSALSKAGFTPRHVALVSDAFGYDIAYECCGVEKKVEVKSCVPSTQRHIYLSRNEFNKARQYPEFWRLIQVTFSSSVILKRTARATDVLEIRELKPSELIEFAPKDTTEFKWLESAKFEPHPECWCPSELSVNDDYKVNFEKLS